MKIINKELLISFHEKMLNQSNHYNVGVKG